MKIRVHEVVYRRLCDVALAQGKTKKEIIQDALVRTLGLESVPLEDEEIYGEKEPASKA